MENFDNCSFSLVNGGRRVACTVCCEHFGHDCDLVEMQIDDGRRFLMCFGPGCNDCGFTVGIELSDFQIRQVARLRIEELRRQQEEVVA